MGAENDADECVDAAGADVKMMVVKISRTQGMATCLAIWMSGAMVGLPWSGWAQGSAGNVREAEAPETRAISSTNGVPALPAQRFDALRRLEEQLNQSLKRFAPRNESEGVATQIRPNPQPAVIDRRSDTKLKDAFDRKKNWGFMGLEEMMGLPKSEEAYGETEESGSNPKTKRSLVEQYYESLGKKGPGQDSALKTDDRPLGTANSSKNDESLPPRLRETQNNLRKIFDNDGNGRIFESTPEHSSASDIFGLGRGGMSAANADIARRAYLNQYRDVLGMTVPGAEASKLLDPMSTANSKSPLSASAPLGGTSGRGAGFGQLGTINPILTPKGPENVNTRALNQWNPMYTPPKIESKPMLPPRQTFDAPRRKF